MDVRSFPEAVMLIGSKPAFILAKRESDGSWVRLLVAHNITGSGKRRPSSDWIASS
jgi:hypothetical protein